MTAVYKICNAYMHCSVDHINWRASQLLIEIKLRDFTDIHILECMATLVQSLVYKCMH